jgi:signal transduction histidine kinase
MAFFLSNRKLEAEISKRTAEACDEIISEMGAELHDDLIQKLSVFRLYLDRLERLGGDAKEIESLSIKMRTEFDQVVHAVRNISRRLLPVKTEGETLEKTIQILCQHMEHAGTGHVHFQNTGSPVALQPQVERYVFRIIQELIHNAFKHSSAWHVWVRLQWMEKTLLIEVEDDGTGFSRIPDLTERLNRKYNTLKLRSKIIGADIRYSQGAKGLLARLALETKVDCS